MGQIFISGLFPHLMQVFHTAYRRNHWRYSQQAAKQKSSLVISNDTHNKEGVENTINNPMVLTHQDSARSILEIIFFIM